MIYFDASLFSDVLADYKEQRYILSLHKNILYAIKVALMHHRTIYISCFLQFDVFVVFAQIKLNCLVNNNVILTRMLGFIVTS